MPLLKNSRVLITGAGHGLGRALALAFAKEGSELVLTDRNKIFLDESIALVTQEGIKASGYFLDVTHLDSIPTFLKQLHLEIGPIDILVNNAGVVQGGEFLKVPVADHLKTYSVNVLGLTALTHAFLPDIIQSKNGALVNIASASSFIGLPYAATYAASKWAVLGFSESLRAELDILGHKHVCITTVSPSYISTGMFEGSRPFKFSRLLDADYVAFKTIQGLKRKKATVVLPFFIRGVPLLKAIFPRQWYEWVFKALGATDSMSHWRGSQPKT